jgi:hypothetical protein
MTRMVVCVLVGVVGLAAEASPTWAACQDCDYAQYFCSPACGSLGIDKWFCKAASGGTMNCSSFFRSCRIQNGQIIQDCESWCEADGNACSGFAKLEATQNGAALASWAGTLGSDRCLSAEPTD